MNKLDTLHVEFARDAKRLLRETMPCLTRGRRLLGAQWKSLKQDPKHGIELMTEIWQKFPDVPIVFYSRKITPQDVWRVLVAGAVDAMQKGALTDHDVLARLARAQQICKLNQAKELAKNGLNANHTIFP